ncbi:MAG: hypothetical protein ACREAY_03380 [Nitrososphaera sp.]|uniref:hypothetical protein n=1 Tax=Nitrososphaera sp. TaxID=1971748 RepID=UPI003D70207C
MAKSDRTKIGSAAAAAILLAGLLIGFPMTAAVHDDNLFELGGVQAADILGDDNAANGPDWGFVAGTSDDGLFNATGFPVGLAASGGIDAQFIIDDTSQKGAIDKTTFSGAGGSNKNNDPIFGAGDTWHWDSGNVPAKDDLVNVYAYATVNPANDHLVIYAGFERLDPSGDSHIDIEFLQDDIELDEAVPCNDPGSDTTPCNFTGSTTNGRTAGDLIVSMDFTTGGGIGEFSIREFTGTEYVLVEPALTTEGCDSGDTACAFNNGVSINGGPWVNIDRQGNTITNIPQNGFTEFGIDVTGLIGEGEEIPCITTFMGKTRSSQSFTAELKDFAGPAGFNICSANISIAPDDVNEVGEPHTFTVEVNQDKLGVETPAVNGTIVTVTLTDSDGAVSEVISDTCADPGTVGGTCSITFTSQTPGNVTGHAAANVTVDGQVIPVQTDGTGKNSGDAVKEFIGRPILKISEFGYTNEPTGIPKSGVVNGTATYTAVLKNFGNAAALMNVTLTGGIQGGVLSSGSLEYVGSTGPAGVSEPVAGTSCVAGCTATWNGVPLAAGATQTFTIAVEYEQLPDGTVVEGDLTVEYKTNVSGSSLTRTASGSPATILFTVQSD